MDARELDRDRLGIDEEPLAASVLRLTKPPITRMDRLERIAAIHRLVQMEPRRDYRQLVSAKKDGQKKHAGEQCQPLRTGYA